MAYYNSYSKDYLHGDELVKKIYREMPRHSHGHAGRPTQCIVNDGTLVIDDKSLRQNSSLIYNRPGSTMYVQPTTSAQSHHQQWGTSGNPNYYSTDPYYYSGAYNATMTSPHSRSNMHACRGCSWQRQLTGGYCRECIDLKLIRPRVVEVVRDERRMLGGPERRMLEYR